VDADKLKLVLAVLILLVGIVAYYYLGDRPDLIRVGALLGAGVVAVTVAMLSAQGRAAWEFAKGSRMELRKVVWPSNKETIQVTLVVFVIVILIALYLWVVDWGLQKGVLALTGPGA